MDAKHAERLIEKLKAGTPCGVAVAFVRDMTANDQDGHTWLFAATDGSQTRDLTATLSGTELGPLREKPDISTREVALELRAGGYPKESRLDDFTAAPVTLTAADFVGAS